MAINVEAVDLGVVNHNAEVIHAAAKSLLGDLRWNKSASSIGGGFIGEGIEILLNHGAAPDQIIEMVKVIIAELLAGRSVPS